MKASVLCWGPRMLVAHDVHMQGLGITICRPDYVVTMRQVQNTQQSIKIRLGKTSDGQTGYMPQTTGAGLENRESWGCQMIAVINGQSIIHYEDGEDRTRRIMVMQPAHWRPSAQSFSWASNFHCPAPRWHPCGKLFSLTPPDALPVLRKALHVGMCVHRLRDG